MRTLATLLLFVSLTSCAHEPKTIHGCDNACADHKAPIVDTKFEGISLAKLNGQPVVLVERLRNTEIVQASTKSREVDIVRISKRPVQSKKRKLKANFGDSQGSGSGFVGGQSGSSIFVIRPAEDKTVIVCGETQNPCAVDDGVSTTHATCGSEFGKPDSDQPLDEYYSENESQIQEFCAGSGDNSI